MSKELWRLRAEEIARQVKMGELSAQEVFASTFERLCEVEPRIEAYLGLLGALGRERALSIDRRRSHGESLGALAGVPFALKDNISFAGQPLTCGSKILTGYVAPFSATAVDRLLAADAVPIGRCNLDEFGMGSSCENSAFKLSRNPWRLDRVPGGSSGGSAASVATGLPLALGSDTGGSIRQPAALCGVVGLKPTYGRVSRYGLVAFASSTDQIGPLTRNVRDAALVLKVIAGHDSHDPTTAHQPMPDPLLRVEEGIVGLRIGIIRELDMSIPPPLRRCWEEALEQFADLGASVIEVSVPHVMSAIACYDVIAASEASSNLARFDTLRYGRRVAGVEHLSELYGKSRGAAFGAEVKRRILFGTHALSAGYHGACYGSAQGVRQMLETQLAAALEEVDLLVMPTTPAAAFKIGERAEDPLAMCSSDVYTAPASLAGLPAISVPCGLDSQGLPLGLQIVAPPFQEDLLLCAGRAFEQKIDFAVEPGFVEP